MADQFLRLSLGDDDRIRLCNDTRVLRDRMYAHTQILDRLIHNPVLFTTARQLVQVYNGGLMGSAPDLYYFTHPVLVTGIETEGGTAALSTDTTTTICVVVLGNTPSVGDYLTAYAIGGRWVAERSRLNSATIACSPCSIPTEDLTISWTNLLTQDGSMTMTYMTGPLVWIATCVDNGLIFKLQCNSGDIELRVIFFLSGACPDGESNYCSNLGVSPLVLMLSDYTCSPFSLSFTVGEDDCPAIYGAGNVQFTITL